jgi:DNA-binding transcriptional MerR regulator
VKIGEAAAASGISERMIRHYEKIGLIDEAARRDSGYRDYREREVRTLQFIGRAISVSRSTRLASCSRCGTTAAAEAPK